MSSPPAAAERGVRVCLHLAFWIPLAGCTYMALTPSPPEAVFRIGDVVLHALAFTYLTFALGLAFPALGTVRIVVWMLAYGAAIEVLQSFEPERATELKDLLVDALGIGLGLLARHWFGAVGRALVGWVVGLMSRG